ncbi:MAG: PAS domain S-box protein [Desulfobacterium sp.]|jgi:PAS domain S-box-containing protein|nr:PAS domain S-box protein [Desulfobacterium sp.]
MIPTGTIGFINNVALLVCMGFFYDILTPGQINEKKVSSRVVTGIILGGMGIVVMLNPWELSPGVRIDPRSILLCITGLFFGTIPVAVAIFMTALYRILIGGAGTWVGVGIIVTSGAVGLAWRYLRKKNPGDFSIGEIFLIGLVVHILVLAWMLILPQSVKGEVLYRVSLPVLLVFPLGTALLGRLVVNRHGNRQIKEDLKKSEENYRTIYENAVEGFFQSTPQGRFISVNPSFANIFGYKSANSMISEIVDIPTQFYVNPEDRQRYLKLLQKTGHVQNFEFKALRRDGSRIWVSESARVIHDDEGNPLRFEGNIMDITRQKQTLERLKASEAWNRSVIQTAMDGYWLTSSDGNLLEINDAYCRMSGYDEQELLSMDIRQITSDHTADKVLARIKTIIERGGDRFETRHRRKDGTLFDVEASVQYRRDEDRFIYFLRDLTQRKQLEERIVQAQKMEAIGTLAGGIAHDFNNILFPIMGMAEMLLEDLAPGSPEHENTRIILESGRRGSKLVKQILTFSRQDEYKLVPIRVQQVVKEVLKLSRSTISTNIEISQDLEAGCGLVMADPTQLHQIAMNLITNALHAVEEIQGKIDVRVHGVTLQGNEWSDPGPRPGKYALLSVSDNGHGISPDVMVKIFEPYFTTKERGKGTGLGLAIIYGILTEYKGEIKIYSEQGKGTTVNVYLPLMDRTAEKGTMENLISPKGGNERILLVDDEEPIVRLQRLIFERLGYQVTVRTSSLEALEAFRANPDRFDLVVTDMNMPNMTGAQLARELIALRPDIPIIVSTGFSETLDKKDMKELGIKDFLMKPVVKSEMARVVRRVLDER